MERKIVIASHGGAAKGIYDSVNMILGNIHTDIEVFTLQPGQNALSFAQKIEKQIQQESNKEFIILTDIYGASVCSAMYMLINHPNVWLFSGVNVNMLLDICLSYPNNLTKQDAQQIVLQAQAGIQWLTKEETEDEDF